MGTVQKCLKGGDVNEGINLHKKMFEALIQTKIEYLNSNTTDQIVSRDAIFENFARDMSSTSFSKVVDSGIVKLLPKLKGDMPWLIDLYLEMVDMLLNFIHFLRTGNWQGYLEIIFQFLPYCFSLNRHNYARNLTYYYVVLERRFGLCLGLLKRRRIYGINYWQSTFKTSVRPYH